jgi:hypothetical protein
MADEGFGTTITFQSGFFAQITNVGWDGIERGDIDTSHMTTTEGWMTFIPSDLKNAGELTVEISFDPDDAPPITAAPETITVTHPIPAGGNTAATWACSGYMKSFGNAIPHDGKMTGTAVLKFSGKPTFTAGT